MYSSQLLYCCFQDTSPGHDTYVPGSDLLLSGSDLPAHLCTSHRQYFTPLSSPKPSHHAAPKQKTSRAFEKRRVVFLQPNHTGGGLVCPGHPPAQPYKKVPGRYPVPGMPAGCARNSSTFSPAPLSKVNDLSDSTATLCPASRQARYMRATASPTGHWRSGSDEQSIM